MGGTRTRLWASLLWNYCKLNCPGHWLRFTIFFEKSGAGTPNSNRLPGRVSALQSRAGGRFVAMNLSMLEQQLDPTPLKMKFMDECTRLTNEALREIRTISYLLHPPMLDEVGLASALRWYVNGFSDRSQIKVKLEIPEALGRYRLELEIAVFRIVQEALSNVHRHSKSETAQITLIESPRHLRLKVEDRGKGMSLPISGLEKDDANMPGVGISGIRERVRQLGGQMQIRSGEWGTALEVFFPAESSSEAANFEAAGA